MKLRLERVEFNSRFTIGKLYVDGLYECLTLEDPLRSVKVYGDTAIPVGDYRVTVNLSNRMKRLTPLLHKVPQFEGIRIHCGNTQADTLGCILVGRKQYLDGILESKLAFDALLPKIQAALTKQETVSIEIL